jgi:hypothetical protein
MWSDCWVSARTSSQSWATSSARTDPAVRFDAARGRRSTTGLLRADRRAG